MTDINKYLENQLALAKQKNHKSIKEVVSKKSQDAAENISKKQNKNLQTLRKNNKSVSKEAENSTSLTKCDTDDGDSDYVVSSDDDKTGPSTPFTVRTKKHIRKIIDDGNKHVFNERITKWKQNIKNALSGTIDLSSIDYYTADLQYLLDGNTDVEDSHELQNGFCIPQYIWKQLYKYQKTGVKWLWELHQVEGGGLLGDEMGLGKTVQIIAFLAGLAMYNSGPWVGLGPTIIVAPATVIYQWVSHFHYWCPNLRIAVLHHSGSHSGNHNQLLRDVQASHGILLITYEGVVKYNKCLLSYKWHYLILDEGHKIRNPETQVSKLVKKFQTPHKLLITGSPMQNNLQELWSLFDFMRPGLLGTHKAFMEHFAVPITQGGYANATEFQEATALEIAKALKNMITPYLLRRTKAEVQEHIKLPEKNEQVLFCALTQEQKDLYMGYLTSTMVKSILDKESRYGYPLRARVLIALSTLRKICNHPDIYLYESHEDGDDINEDTFGHWKRSGKMTVVQSLLKIWQKQGHRTLIFSQSRAMLCILEQHLQNNNYKYLKMDGTVSVSIRQSLIKTFNENKEYLVFLATTRVGGLGVNLTGADRVIIYDPDWNPATDNQAKERAWRIGQQRNVTVYRLLSAGTIEEKIYQRQIFKNFLSSKVLIDPNQKNVLTTSTLQGLFTLEEPNFEGDTETASLFKHTKVKINKKLKKESDKANMNSSASFSKKKIEAMKRLAKQISKKISTENVSMTNEDPRERYKRKRHLLLNPPKIVDEPEINLVDDKVTNVPFESVLSELDIVSMHVKENYEENLLKEVLNNQDAEIMLEEKQVDDSKLCDTDMVDCKENKVELIDTSTVISLPEVANTDQFKNINNDHIQNTNTDHIEISNNDQIENTNSDQTKNTNTVHIENTSIAHIEHPSTGKRRHSTSSDPGDVIENLVAIKKVKKKKLKHTKDTDDDDYVLKKLFAKSTVKNALHHDVVIGLAEKEKRYRIKEEATKRAKKAVKALKQSANINV